jgi:hypothetical protein
MGTSLRGQLVGGARRAMYGTEEIGIQSYSIALTSKSGGGTAGAPI